MEFDADIKESVLVEERLRNLKDGSSIMYDTIRKFSSGKKINLTLNEKSKLHLESDKSIFNLKKIYPDIQYIIAGEGDQLENIKKEIKNYNLESNVKLVGTINENQKKFIFSKTDIMTVSYTHLRAHETLRYLGCRRIL